MLAKQMPFAPSPSHHYFYRYGWYGMPVPVMGGKHGIVFPRIFYNFWTNCYRKHFSAICWVNSPFFGDQIQWPSWRCQFFPVAQVVNKATRAATQMLHENLPPQKMGHKMKRSKPPSPDLPRPFFFLRISCDLVEGFGVPLRFW